MSFIITDIVIEKLIRQELKKIQTDTDTRTILIEDLFGTLDDTLLNSKYGEDIANMDKVLKNDINVLHAFPDVDSKFPSFSIHLQSDNEDVGNDMLGNYIGEFNETITPATILSDLSFTSYNKLNKEARVADSVDLSTINRGDKLKSGSDEITIDAVSNVQGDKYLILNTSQETISMTGNSVTSQITTRIHSEHEIITKESVMIGVHSRNSFLTRYLYNVLKVIMYKNMYELAKYCIQNPIYIGSDLHMDQVLLPERVFSRFLTVSCTVRNSWRQEVLKQNVSDLGAGLGVNYETQYSPRPDEDQMTLGTVKGDK